MKKSFCDFCGDEILKSNLCDVFVQISVDESIKQNPLKKYEINKENGWIHPEDVCNNCAIGLAEAVNSWFLTIEREKERKNSKWGDEI